MTLTLSWNGTAMVETVGNFSRTLRTYPELAGVEWDAPETSVGEYGAFQTGPGVPAAREVTIELQSAHTNPSGSADLQYDLQEEMDSLNWRYSPALGECQLKAVRTNGTATRTRYLWARTRRAYNWRMVTDGGQVGSRHTGVIVYPVVAVARLPWWVEPHDQIAGNFSSLDGIAATGGEAKSGWLLGITNTGTGTPLTNPVEVSLDGTVYQFKWDTGISLAQDSTAYLSFWYPMSDVQRVGVTSWTETSAGVRSNWGVIALDASSGLSTMPFLPAQSSTIVSVTVTGLTSGTTTFDYASLCGSV